MNTLKTLQKEFSVLLLCIAISVIFIIFTHSLSQSAYEEKQMAVSNLKHARDNYYTAINQKLLLDQFESDFKQLQKEGVFGEENRLNWVDSIEKITKQHAIPYLKYKIDQRLPADTNLLSQPYPDIELYKSVMSLQIQLLHEGDLFTVLDELTLQAKGLFDTERCKISRIQSSHASVVDSPTDKNFNAECILNWYTLNKKTFNSQIEDDI